MRRGRGFRSRWAVVGVLSMLSVGVFGGTASGGASSAAKPDPNGALRLSGPAGPSIWDPHNGNSDPVNFSFMSPVYDQLFRLDTNLVVKPHLALSSELSADQKSLTIKLRKGVTFQDGAPFNAAAVVANLTYTKNAKNALTSEIMAKVTSVTAVDDSTVRVDFNVPVLDFALQSAFKIALGGMVSPKALESPATLRTTPSGSGPYKLVSQTQTTATYEKVANHWDTAEFKRLPKNLSISGIADDNARVAAVQSGQLDAAVLTSPVANIDSVADGKKIKEVTIGGSGRLMQSTLNYVRFPAWNDSNFRLALHKAIDFNAIAKTVCLGTCLATGQPYPKGAPGYNPAVKVPKYDPEGAKKLLAAGNYTNVTIKAFVGDPILQQNLATAVQAMWAKVGVKLDITQIPSNQTQAAQRAGTYDMGFATANPSPDPAAIITSYWTKNATFSPWGEDPEVARMNAAGQLLPLGSKARDKAYQQIAKYLSEKPSTFIWSIWPPQYLYSSKVSGITDQSWGKMNSVWDPRAISIAK